MQITKLVVCGPGLFIFSPYVVKVGVHLFAYLIGLSS
jgi:hypothetical protein